MKKNTVFPYTYILQKEYFPAKIIWGNTVIFFKKKIDNARRQKKIEMGKIFPNFVAFSWLTISLIFIPELLGNIATISKGSIEFSRSIKKYLNKIAAQIFFLSFLVSNIWLSTFWNKYVIYNIKILPQRTDFSKIWKSVAVHCTEVWCASFFPGGFLTAIVVNPPERRLAKRTSVHWGNLIFGVIPSWLLLYEALQLWACYVLCPAVCT